MCAAPRAAGCARTRATVRGRALRWAGVQAMEWNLCGKRMVRAGCTALRWVPLTAVYAHVCRQLYFAKEANFSAFKEALDNPPSSREDGHVVARCVSGRESWHRLGLSVLRVFQGQIL